VGGEDSGIPGGHAGVDGCREAELHAAVVEANRKVEESAADLKRIQSADRENLLLCKMPYGGKMRLRDGRTVILSTNRWRSATFT